jgi:hypothetical protein
VREAPSRRTPSSQIQSFMQSKHIAHLEPRQATANKASSNQGRAKHKAPNTSNPIPSANALIILITPQKDRMHGKLNPATSIETPTSSSMGSHHTQQSPRNQTKSLVTAVKARANGIRSVKTLFTSTGQANNYSSKRAHSFSKATTRRSKPLGHQ